MKSWYLPQYSYFDQKQCRAKEEYISLKAFVIVLLIDDIALFTNWFNVALYKFMFNIIHAHIKSTSKFFLLFSKKPGLGILFLFRPGEQKRYYSNKSYKVIFIKENKKNSVWVVPPPHLSPFCKPREQTGTPGRLCLPVKRHKSARAALRRLITCEAEGTDGSCELEVNSARWRQAIGILMTNNFVFTMFWNE